MNFWGCGSGARRAEMNANGNSNRHLLAAGLTYALLLAAAAKIVLVTFSSPIMGYGNNFDFIRQSSCVGLWQAYQEKPKTSPNPEAPVNSLQYDGDINNGGCMRSSDNVFPYLATVFHKVGDAVDFREISVWKIVFLSAGLALLLFNTPNPLIKLAIAAAFFMVFGDVANLFYANTFYLEFSVVGGCFFSLLAIATYMTCKSEPSNWFFVFAVLSIMWLGLSKHQYMPLASILAFGLSVSLFSRWQVWKKSLVFLAIALMIPLFYNRLNSDDSTMIRSVNFANQVDTFLWAVLPEAADKETALSTLGLPASCLPEIGKNWYSPGVQQSRPCPEVEKLGRVRLLRLFVMDPSTFFTPMQKAMVGVRPFYPVYLGHLESPAERGSTRYRLLKETSFSSLLAGIPGDALLVLSFLSMVLGPPFLITLTTRENSEFKRFLLAMIGLGGVTTGYAIASSVFGDGYAELQKHAVVFTTGMAFQAVGLILLVSDYRPGAAASHEAARSGMGSGRR